MCSRRSASLLNQLIERLRYDLEPKLFSLGQVGRFRKMIHLANDLPGSRYNILAIARK
jgi:hypothetical protein